jgi:hypothetical protein
MKIFFMSVSGDNSARCSVRLVIPTTRTAISRGDGIDEHPAGSAATDDADEFCHRRLGRL